MAPRVKTRLLRRPLWGLLAMSCFSFLLTTVFATEDLSSVQGTFLKGDYKAVVLKTMQLIPRASAAQRDELLYLQGVSALKLRDFELARSSLEQLLKDHPKSRFTAQGAVALNYARQQPAKAAPPQPEESFFTVQVGAFSTRTNAVRLQKELQRKGYDALVSESAGAENTLYRVRVGRFANRQEAEKTSDRLRSDGFPAQVKP